MTTDQDYRNCAKAIRALLENEAHKATLFISDKLTLVATRKLFNGKPNKRQIEIGLTYGPPNYENRKFIKLAKLAKEPFPIRKIQFKFPAKRK